MAISAIAILQFSDSLRRLPISTATLRGDAMTSLLLLAVGGRHG